MTNRLPPEDIQAAEEMNDQMQARLAKKKELDEAGIDPFGRSFEVTHRATDIIDNFDQLEGQHVRVAGRIMALRGHG
ncbi:MAG: lysine--tRNA ligase, partial [Limnochordia bacterium]|nr:lysine--tRNA ligase [Limnochordia bacterium]